MDPFFWLRWQNAKTTKNKKDDARKIKKAMGAARSRGKKNGNAQHLENMVAHRYIGIGGDVQCPGARGTCAFLPARARRQKKASC